MRARFASQLRRLAADTRGSSMIEMAFILPMLVMLGCGAVDVATCYARQMQLQQAAARTMEFAIAGGFGRVSTDQITAEGTTAAGAGTNVVVTPTMWLECDGVAQAAGTTSCASGSPSRFASITITDTYNWMFEALIDSWNHSPYSVQLKGYAEVRIQ